MTKQYKMLLDGNTVKDKFDEDIILNKEPKKITNERFEILLFTKEEWENLKQIIDLKIEKNDTDKETYEQILKKVNEKAQQEISGVFDLQDWLNFGVYKHIDEYNIQFIEDLEIYPFSIWEGEAVGDYGAGQTLIDSDCYGVQVWNGSNWTWIEGNDYEEIR